MLRIFLAVHGARRNSHQISTHSPQWTSWAGAPVYIIPEVSLSFDRPRWPSPYLWLLVPVEVETIGSRRRHGQQRRPGVSLSGRLHTTADSQTPADLRNGREGHPVTSAAGGRGTR